MNRFLNSSKGTGGAPRGFLPFGKALAVAACALSMAFVGCSQKAGKNKTVIGPPDGNTDPKNVVSKLDSLVKNNKGKGVITGFLAGEGKSLAAGILGKTAANAAGERRLLTKESIPLSGATVLIFDALKPTTAADTTLKTDSAGNYTCVLPEGQYFGFAVYLDLETFQLVTTSIPNMNPKADTIVKMDTATAIEDATAPTVAGVYDAASANSDGIFLVGSVPDKNAKINITFSEPMNRESVKGVILGKIDTSNTSTSLVLADTVKGISVSWSGDSKELTLMAAELATGVQYGLILPTTLKDLAKNPLEKEYKATFVTVAASEFAKIEFAVASTFPADGGELKPIQNPGVSFNRPVEVFSVLKNATIEPAVTGFWEVSGARAVFVHKEPLVVGKTYKVTLPTAVLDLTGGALKAAHSYSFTVKDFEGAAKDNSGEEKEVALSVEAMFDAYLSGDLGRFAAAFHPNFRMYEDGTIRAKGEFLDMIRADVAEQSALSAGILGPVFYNKPADCKDYHNFWKVLPQGGGDEVWVSSYVAPGQSPMVYDKDMKAVAAADIAWDQTGPRFTYKTKVYGFGPDMSKFRGPVNVDAAREDIRFMGEVLKQTSTVALEPVKLEKKDEFKVDAAVTLSGDTAKLAVKMIGYHKFSRLNFREMGPESCGNSELTDTSFQILKFILVKDGAKWLVSSIMGGDKVENRDDFNKAIDTKNFAVKNILPITLVAPLRDKAQDADGKVTFKFKGPAHDSIGGYLVGLAEDPKFCFGRPPVGALIFVKASNKKGDEESFVFNKSGAVEGTNASAILRRVFDLRLPGWERTMFENVVSTLFDKEKGFGGVYQWKVIAVKDTSATQFLANGFNPDRFYAESDFGPTRGYFACDAFPQGDAAFNALQTAQNNFVNTQPMQPNSFADSDLDGVPDGIEVKYKTDPRNRNSYPEFRTDTDGDGLADFLEAMLDPNGADSLLFKKTDEAGRKAEIGKLVALGIVWQDSDADGFPDDIEMMAGFNPMDPRNNPGTRARASAPLGGFVGKFQMGSSLNSISFKLSTDSTKSLTVSYLAVIGTDTLIDTLKTVFNEMSGEVYIPVIFKSGPDVGRALLLRGRYDQNMALIMGPMDMIPAPAKGSVNFGSGPFVGQFAASGRGEDVSRYLPMNNGGPGAPIVNGPVNPPMSGPMGYRNPPLGTDTGAVIVFDGSTVIYINSFGDTLARTPGAMFRGQPDGSFDYEADFSFKSADGRVFKHTQAGGHIFNDGQGNWVVDGHFFQESDSNGIHMAYPGQMCARVAKADFTVGLTGAKGSMHGWIFQDKSGSGFQVNPQQPACDPTRGPCTTQPPCDPAMGPCTTQPPPPTSFGRPFMAGADNYRMILSDKLSVKAGEYFYVSMGGRVYRAKNDTVGVSAALFPMCGHTVLKLELLPLKDESDMSRQARNSDSMAFQIGSSIVVAMEDQFIPGKPALMDKARDSYGEVRSNLVIVEMRPVGIDYGRSGTQCPSGTVQNPPPCDPATQICTNLPPPCDPAKGPCPIDTAKCDPTRQVCGTQPPPCDPAMGPCTQPPPGPALFAGSIDVVRAALTASGNILGIPKDSAGNYNKVSVNGTSLFKDQMSGFVLVADLAGATKYKFLADPMDRNKLAVRDNIPMAVPDGAPIGNPPPGDTGTVVTNPPPADSTRPLPYKGTVENLRTLLDQKGWKASIPTQNGPIQVSLDDVSLKFDGTLTVASEAGNPARLFVFMGDKVDPAKPALDPMGYPLVMEKSLTAGP